jgi:NTE family protein
MATNNENHCNPNHPAISNQVVLVMQGGGALGAFQAGVYEALHEAAIEPDWVIGTSIGAINAAIIVGNPPEQRLTRIKQFWQRMQYHSHALPGISPKMASFANITQGIPAFYQPNPLGWLPANTPMALEQTAYYCTDPLRSTLEELVDFEYINQHAIRLTVGAVNVRSGEMRYFDSRNEVITPSHIMASGALPPAFPAVRIDGEAYWDGGIYSNTPIEAVLDDNPRRDSVIFSVQLWHSDGPEPQSMADVMSRHKDIQYASRDSHLEQQRKLHRLRHIIRQLARYAPPEAFNDPRFKELKSWGCRTTMHVVKLNAPFVAGEDAYKDVDFSPQGIRTRWQAGYQAGQNMIAAQPWLAQVDPIEGVMIHNFR